ncbi:MAG: 30S ribosomal protein S20 [Bacteriovoracaceae bacterium]|nr:30S ribosomal protein S20 [Bacteriovoracaceae bacterium]
MANHKSAKKRAKQTVVRTERNKTRRTEMRTAVKKIREAIAKGEKDAAVQLLPEAQSTLRKLAKNGVIKQNTAARRTGRLARQIAKL